ncbi:hypothetical protein N657DRAFT_689268 [Parathielavia appendiculata]|uniref:VLRF1 domain-containing protein n=1 Tax=Parathielavia appendiculata TaxID=2587402 RepID=A0AAN6U200_9PEZI|nr:hypothetical protein N657DRAFT_689268 [Parathielavia appendiculata]
MPLLLTTCTRPISAIYYETLFKIPPSFYIGKFVFTITPPNTILPTWRFLPRYFSLATSTMCYITKNVYTVCAHTRMGGLVECEHQKARNERWEDGSFCLTLLSCRPVEQTKLKYWFCDGCREHYDGCDTMTVEAVLNYWAFKNAHGYSSSVSPKLIAAESVFGSRAPARKDDPKHPRRELMALGKVLPRKPFETPVAWLQRLEEARTLTLELAAKWSAVVGHQRQRRERIGERVVHMQPRISTPMSVYPYAHALSSITELMQHCQTNDGKFTGVSLNEAPTKHETEEFDQPNMTSHFSVSDIDPDEAAALARVDAVSPISVEVAMDKMKTSSRVSETRLPEEHETAPVTVLEIVAPQPRRSASPPRFVQEYGGAATEDRSLVDDASTGGTPSQKQSPSPAGTENVLGSQACSLCGMSFLTVQEQKDHLKTDVHYYNLKQKLNGLRPVSEAEFEKLVNENDVSISGSDTSDSDEDEDESSRRETTISALLKKQASLADSRGPNGGDKEEEPKAKRRGTGKPPLLWFSCPLLPENTYFGIYRAMFTADELDREDAIIDAIKQRQLPPISMPKAAKDGNTVPPVYNGRHIFLCMIGGGHFAAMVVCLAPKQSKQGSIGPLNREAVVLAHKTFHRYTTRRKQGGSQSANDNAKGTAHSAGSSLRRYNEQALVEDVRELLKDWKALIDTSDLLFIRATGSTNRRTLFGPYDDQVLRPNDPRIRGFPFSTRRATQNELMRSFIELTRLKVKEIQPEAASVPNDESKTPKTKVDSKTAPPKLTEEEEAAIFHTSQIQAMIRRSKLPALLSYLTTNSLSANFLFQPPDSQQNHHAPTALHLAASQNSAPLVTGLLARAQADPTILSSENKTPFDLAGDRATRDAFRVARAELGEEAWDWDAARVPAPLKREEAEQRAERERRALEREEEARRRAEEERLRAEGPRLDDSNSNNAGGRRKKGGNLLGGGGPPKTAEERRAEEARGLTPEQRMRLERERRARAAEERIRRLQQGGA